MAEFHHILYQSDEVTSAQGGGHRGAEWKSEKKKGYVK